MKNLVIISFLFLTFAVVQAHAQGKPLRLKTAAVLVDSADNVIGPVFDAQLVDSGGIFNQPEVTFAHVAFELEDVSFFLRGDRLGFINQTVVFFEMPDCSGNALLLATFGSGSLLLPGVIFRDAVYVPDRVEPQPWTFVSIQSRGDGGFPVCDNTNAQEITAVTATKFPFDASQFVPPFRTIRQ